MKMQTRSTAKNALAAAPLKRLTQSSSSTVAAFMMLGSCATRLNSCTVTWLTSALLVPRPNQHARDAGRMLGGWAQR